MNEPTRILVVEDNEDDAFFMRRALQSAAPAAAVQILTDGRAARDRLLGAGAYADRAAHPLPHLVFLDLKLPYLHGLEVLALVRAAPAVKGLPVVVLTSSDETRDRTQAQAFGIVDYLVKPPSPAMLRAVFARMAASPAPAGASVQAAPR